MKGVEKPPTPPTRFEKIGKVATTITSLIGVPAALIGVPATLVAFVFLLAPNWAPWTSLRVDIGETSIEHNATVEDFSQRAYLNPERPQESADLAVVDVPPSYKNETVGNVVSYRLETEGFARRTVRVFWSVYEESGQRVSDDDPNDQFDLSDQFGWPSNNYKAKRRVNVVSGDAFVPLPQEDGTYFVKIGVWDGLGVRMDIVDSPKFEVVQGRSKEVPPDSGTTK